MTHVVSAATAESSEEYDEYAAMQPGFTHFHRFGWRRVIERTFGHDCPYLIARASSGEVAGVLPLVRVKSRLFGDFLVSMPYLNYGGPLGDAAAQRALVDRATELAVAAGADLLELRCREERHFGLGASTRKVTVLLDLPADKDVLFKSFDAKLRSQVRRPMKEGVEVRFGAENLDDFHAVFATHMRDLGTPVMPLSFFRNAAKEFGDSMWVGVARLNDAPVACGIGFRWNDEFEMTWASSLRDHARIAPNMLLYWSFMERCVAEGVRTFNFGRCTPGGGTHRFKRQWNGRDEQLWWYQHSKSGIASTPSPDGKFSLGPRIWRHLPLPVANALGPLIVRSIP